MNGNKKKLTHITIPGEVAFNTKLSYLDGIVFWMINCLDGEEHCYATNNYIAHFLKINSQSVSNSISKLKSFRYIKDISKKKENRILKIDNSYIKRYNYLIDEFNKPYKKNYIEDIKKIIIYNYKDKYNNSLSKDKESKQACDTSFIPKLINKKRLRIALQEMTNPITDKKIQKSIEYWNKKGKPFPKHCIQNSKIIKRINSLLRRRIKRDQLTPYKIIKAIDFYYEFVTSPFTTISKPVSMSQFILFDDTYITKVKGKRVEVNSWLDECLKGKDYLFKTYGRYVKNSNPQLTEKIWKLWKDKKLFINNKDATYMENNFRIAADKVVTFITENGNRLKLGRLEKTPLMFINYVFNAALNGGDNERMRPGSISNDYFYSEILPSYLKKNGFMN